MSEIPEILNKAFQEYEISPENILEVVYKDTYLIPENGKQRDEVFKASVLNNYFFSWFEHEPNYVVKSASLLIRYKNGEQLGMVCLEGKEEILSTRLWMRHLFEGNMQGKHVLSDWYRNKVQNELADYIAGNTIEIKGFKYPFQISKVVVSYKDLERVTSGYRDLYDLKGQEIYKRGFRVPTKEEWLHFAKSMEGQEILRNQYKNANGYEICMADIEHTLQINVKTHELVYLDYEYRRVHPGPLREGFYRYVKSSVPASNLFSENYVDSEADRAQNKAKNEYEEYSERREPWDC